MMDDVHSDMDICLMSDILADAAYNELAMPHDVHSASFAQDCSSVWTEEPIQFNRVSKV